MPHLVELGCTVVFDKDMVIGRDLNMMANEKTTVTARFRRERNVLALDANVSIGDDAKKKKSDFHWRR